MKEEKTMMNKFEIPRTENIPDGNRKILEGLKMAFGFIPNVYAFIAYSPVALKSYLHFTREKTSLSDREAEAIYLATSQVNECLYCLSAHTFLSKAAGFTDEQILELRQGKASFDPHLDVIAGLTREIVEKRGKTGDEHLRRFYAAGYENKHLVDLVLLISQIMVTNYINNITHNKIDFPEAPRLETED